jgi:hypothetical protein
MRSEGRLTRCDRSIFVPFATFTGHVLILPLVPHARTHTHTHTHTHTRTHARTHTSHTYTHTHTHIHTHTSLTHTHTHTHVPQVRQLSSDGSLLLVTQFAGDDSPLGQAAHRVATFVSDGSLDWFEKMLYSQFDGLLGEISPLAHSDSDAAAALDETAEASSGASVAAASTSSSEGVSTDSNSSSAAAASGEGVSTAAPSSATVADSAKGTGDSVAVAAGAPSASTSTRAEWHLLPDEDMQGPAAASSAPPRVDDGVALATNVGGSRDPATTVIASSSGSGAVVASAASSGANSISGTVKGETHQTREGSSSPKLALESASGEAADAAGGSAVEESASAASPDADEAELLVATVPDIFGFD